jgi:hypothetical protein
MFGMSETVAENIAAGAKLDGQDAIFRSFKQRNTACVLIRPGADLKIENNEESLDILYLVFPRRRESRHVWKGAHNRKISRLPYF